MSVTDNDNPSAADPVGAESRPAARHKRTIIVTILLLAVLALAGWFRFNGVRWDSDSHLHPDERFLTDLASNLHSVESPLDYFRTSVSTLNPYNVGRTFYVYGNFPMTATRYAANGRPISVSRPPRATARRRAGAPTPSPPTTASTSWGVSWRRWPTW